MKIEMVKKLAQRQEIDYPFLLSVLKNYACPRDKISEWLKKGELIRIKKGLYIFGDPSHHYSKEVIANLIYGPSAVSATYALAYYGFIPERVETITSITPKRYKYFSTPIGDFYYFYLHPKKYAVGLDFQKISSENCLIATPEKALCDQLILSDKKITLQNTKAMEHYLCDDLRIDKSALRTLRINKLKEIAKVYEHKKIDLLIKFLKDI